jgi:hypothetical protein
LSYSKLLMFFRSSVFIQATNPDPGHKTDFCPFFQCLCKLSVCISRPPDRFASRRGSEIWVPDWRSRVREIRNWVMGFHRILIVSPIFSRYTRLFPSINCITTAINLSAAGINPIIPVRTGFWRAKTNYPGINPIILS